MSGSSSNWGKVFVAMTILGVLIFAAGLLLLPGNAIPLVVGAILFAIGVKCLIADFYKQQTGKETGGGRFWKRVLGTQQFE